MCASSASAAWLLYSSVSPVHPKEPERAVGAFENVKSVFYRDAVETAAPLLQEA